GRTGRAGRTGKSILFVTPRQTRMKRDIEQYTKQQIEPLKLPTQSDIVERRVSSLKEKIMGVLTDQDLELYLSLVEDFAEENGCDIAEIAAAAIFLTVGDKTLEVKAEPIENTKFHYPESGMVKLFFNVGRNHRVSPADFVGAIANEANVPGKAIGAIDVNDRFTLVDVPKEFVAQVLSQMSHSKIRSQAVDIRLASEGNPGTERKSAPKENKGFEKDFRQDRSKRKKTRVKFKPTEPRDRNRPPKRKSKKNRN
ncbi:MAG TPA: DbpA RNA binding domain-containing protein, partial [Pyrinomonadaceae bacterium]|nr:DbpA RNA binding domain-containing protein [Pyrinomonadaceae bacterium]